MADTNVNTSFVLSTMTKWVIIISAHLFTAELGEEHNEDLRD